MSNPPIAESGPEARRGRPDDREQLYNGGLVGPIREVQLPLERIVRLNAFMYDLDPSLLVPGNPLFPPDDDPRSFRERIRATLDRHPLARHAEVRSSGRGLHAIVRLDPPVELETAADRRRWETMVCSAQCSLPADPRAPGITALTRPVGSVNSKNGSTVRTLSQGRPVDPGEVEVFVRELAGAPFRTVATILLGDDRMAPCPVCRGEGTRLDVMEKLGRCYARCGDVSLEMLLDSVFRPFAPAGESRTEGAVAADSARPRRRGRPPLASASRS